MTHFWFWVQHHPYATVLIVLGWLLFLDELLQYWREHPEWADDSEDEHPGAD